MGNFKMSHSKQNLVLSISRDHKDFFATQFPETALKSKKKVQDSVFPTAGSSLRCPLLSLPSLGTVCPTSGFGTPQSFSACLVAD